MADTGIFATTLEVQYKVGADASTTANAEAYINSFMAQAESRVNVESNYNWSDVYTTLNADVKAILKEAASDLAAMYVINYDLSGFLSIAEAQTRLDVLQNHYDRCITLLKKEGDKVSWVKGAATN